MTTTCDGADAEFKLVIVGGPAVAGWVVAAGDNGKDV